MTAEIIQKELLNINIKYINSFGKPSQEELFLANQLGFKRAYQQTKPELSSLLNHRIIPTNIIIQICEKYKLVCDYVSNYIGHIPLNNLKAIENTISHFKLIENLVDEQTFSLYKLRNHYISLEELYIISNKKDFLQKLEVSHLTNQNLKKKNSKNKNVIFEDSYDEVEDPIVFTPIFTFKKDKHFNKFYINFEDTGYSLIHTMWGAEQILPEIAEFYKNQN